VRHTSGSNDLFHVKASQFRFFQFASKLAEARRRVVHVASLWRLRRSQVEDGRVDMMGYIGPFYPTFVIFIVLGPKDSFVF
jgi:hypothetical protein